MPVVIGFGCTLDVSLPDWWFGDIGHSSRDGASMTIFNVIGTHY